MSMIFFRSTLFYKQFYINRIDPCLVKRPIEDIYDRSNSDMAALFVEFSDLENYLMFMPIKVDWPIQHFFKFF